MGLFKIIGDIGKTTLMGAAMAAAAEGIAYEEKKKLEDAELKEKKELAKEALKEKRKLEYAMELEKLKHKHALELLKAKEEISKDFSSGKNKEHSNGREYEIFCGNLLKEAGWDVKMTNESNDQGVDLIASIENFKVCIQCKRYSSPVGNKGVQEIIAGTLFYEGTHSVVVSSAGFTKSAMKLAKKAGVILLSDEDLEDLEDFI